MTNLAKYNKFWVALAGAVIQVVVAQFPGYTAIAQSILAVLTALSVYVVPNAPATPPVTSEIESQKG